MPPKASQITVSDLESTLAEVEPILRGTDGSFQFTHPSFQEVLTAKQFADEINSGRLSVRDAYEQFWSYEEDAELWGLPKDRVWRALLPAWENVLRPLVNFIDEKYFIQLLQIITSPFLESEKYFRDKDYNPFYSDACYSCKLIGQKKGLKHRLVTEVLKGLSYNISFTHTIDWQKRAVGALGDSRSIEAIPLFESKLEQRQNYLRNFDGQRIRPLLTVENEDICDSVVKNAVKISLKKSVVILDMCLNSMIPLRIKILKYMGLAGIEFTSREDNEVTLYAIDQLSRIARYIDEIREDNRPWKNKKYSLPQSLGTVLSGEVLRYIAEIGTYEATKFLIEYCIENEYDAVIKLIIESNICKKKVEEVLMDLGSRAREKYDSLLKKANDRCQRDYELEKIQSDSKSRQDILSSKYTTYIPEDPKSLVGILLDEPNSNFDFRGVDIIRQLGENGTLDVLRNLFFLRRYRRRFNLKQYPGYKYNPCVSRVIRRRIEEAITLIHNRAKPQGYNPPIKKLAV